MARVSVQKRVPSGTPTKSLAMAVVPAAAPARSEAVWADINHLLWAGFFEDYAGQRLGFSSIFSPDKVTTMVSTPSRMGYAG